MRSLKSSPEVRDQFRIKTRRDDRAAPEVSCLVVESHQLGIGFVRDRSIDKTTICEVFDKCLSPDAWNAWMSNLAPSHYLLT
jgi:hypothetical protein